jgi:hypothetical protein
MRSVGRAEGAKVGTRVGDEGTWVGPGVLVGTWVGTGLGRADGRFVGCEVGLVVGTGVGSCAGASEVFSVGADVGAGVTQAVWLASEVRPLLHATHDSLLPYEMKPSAQAVHAQDALKYSPATQAHLAADGLRALAKVTPALANMPSVTLPEVSQHSTWLKACAL